MIAIDGYLIDAAESEGHVLSSDVTEDEVETGSAFTDVIKNKSDEVTIQGIVSDTPVGDFVDIRARATASGLDEELPYLPSDQAQAILVKIHRDQRPVTIQTSRGTWETMALISLDIPVDDKTGDALGFTAQFRQIRLRSTTLVIVRVAAPQLKGPEKFNRAAFDREFLKGGRILVKAQPADAERGISQVTARWDPDRGSYVYDDGAIVREEDYVPPPGATRNPIDGSWQNPDGSDITLGQYNKEKANPTPIPVEPPDDLPWYTPITATIGRIF